MNAEEKLKKLLEVQDALLQQPATQIMIDRILNNIRMDLIPTFRERVKNGFTGGEAIELENALYLCEQLLYSTEQQKELITMSYDDLCMFNAQMNMQLIEMKNRKL